MHKDLVGGALTNGGLGGTGGVVEDVFTPHAPHKRTRLTPPMAERIMLYVKRDGEKIYTPLHLVPPTTVGLLNAVSMNLFY